MQHVLTAGMLMLCGALACAVPFTPIVKSDVVFLEEHGLVAVEAEHACAQQKMDKRAWYLMTAQAQETPKPDGDGLHVVGASGGAYLEILPDARRTSKDKLITGVTFTEDAGSMAVLSYKVYFQTAGRYYVWARIFSTGAEDNGMHVGIDGTWPESGKRMQWTAKNAWVWGSKQRTDTVHNGVPYQLFLDVDKPGEHVIQFSMREDGTEFDKWLMTREREMPEPKDAGPASKLKSGTLPPPFAVPESMLVPNTPVTLPEGAQLLGVKEIPVAGTPFYIDKERWFSINPTRAKSAAVSVPSPLPTGTYHIMLLAVGENDGQSRYRVSVNGKLLGEFTVPPSTAVAEEGTRYAVTWNDVAVTAGDAITIEAFIASAEGVEYSRGRWSGLAFIPADDATRAAVTAKHTEQGQ